MIDGKDNENGMRDFAVVVTAGSFKTVIRQQATSLEALREHLRSAEVLEGQVDKDPDDPVSEAFCQLLRIPTSQPASFTFLPWEVHERKAKEAAKSQQRAAPQMISRPGFPGLTVPTGQR